MTDDYSALSAVYDRLNADLDYEKWADYIDAQIKAHSDIQAKLVLDLCCGTGTMTLALDRRGYDMTGVDRSPAMLGVAADKAVAAGRADAILFLCQDMLSFELYGTVQAVVSCLDSVNHVDGGGDFLTMLALVRNYLEPGGLFLFDVNTPYKFKEIYGTNAYVLEDEGVLCAWQNFYDPKSRLCEFFTSVFIEDDDGRYTRRDDYERETCFTPAEIRRMLKKSGFAVVAEHGDLDGGAPTRDTERIYFVAKRLK